MNHFFSPESLKNHQDYCLTHQSVKIELPEKGSSISFPNYVRSMRVPFIIYADFESFLPKMDTVQPDANKSYTQSFQKNEPSGFCYYIKAFDDNLQNRLKEMNLEFSLYTKEEEGQDVSQLFVDFIEEDVKEIYKEFSNPK